MHIRKTAGVFLLAMYLQAIAVGQTSFWTNSSVPAAPEDPDTNSVTVGLKFFSDVPGTVTGIRFYKGLDNTGTHVGNLWSSTGANLATVTFSGETASGWQQANFPAPFSIAANTTYIVSYLAPNGRYAEDDYYPWSTLNRNPLHVSGSDPSVYAYGSTATFPTATWNSSNYWVDLVFAPSTSPGPYSISGSVSGSAATMTLSGAAIGSTTTDATGTYTFSGLANGSYVVTPSQSGYTFTPSRASVNVNGAAVTGVNFTAMAPLSHSVTLSWTASASPNIIRYNVYRGSASGGPIARIGFVGGTSYVDTSVSSGQAYSYFVTAVDGSNQESAYSTEATAVIPAP